MITDRLQHPQVQSRNCLALASFPGEVFCGLHVAHVHIICPVRDVTHVRKCTRPSPAFPYCKRRKAGRGPGNEASLAQ